MAEDARALEVPKKTLEEITPGLMQMLQSMFTAARNAQMYPPESPAAIKLVEASQEAIMPMVPPGGCLDISFIEEKLVINGEHVDDAMQKRGIIRNFHQLLKVKKISSVTFWHDMTREDLRKFFLVLTGKPRMNEDGEQVEFSKLMEEEDVQHIEIDEQIYVAISKREKVVDVRAVTEQDMDPAMRALKNEVFARFLSGEAMPGDTSSQAVRDMLADPDKMVAAVHSFVEAHGWSSDMKGLALGVDETRVILERITELLRRVDDPSLRDKLSREVERIAVQIEVPQLKEIVLTGGAAERGTFRPEALLPVVGDEKYGMLLDQLIEEYVMLEAMPDQGSWPSERLDSARTILEQAARARPEWARKIVEASGAAGPPWQHREKDDARSAQLAQALSTGGDMSMCDEASGTVLVKTAGRLVQAAHEDLATAIMQKVQQRFQSAPEQSRPVAARQIQKLTAWLQQNGKVAVAGVVAEEARDVADAYATANAVVGDLPGMGPTGQTDPLYDRLMGSDTGQVVKAVFTADDEAAREAVTRALLQMPDKAIPALLDTVQEATDSQTIESVAGSLREFKDPTPWITSRFTKEMEPWQMVNVVKLFAMVGSSEAVKALDPLLMSPEVEPHLAAINALADMGGKTALQMLLDDSMLPDPIIQVPALRALGKFHDYMAVRRLTMIVTPGKKGEITESDQALIAACRSLGDLKAGPAIGLISDLALGRHGIKVSEEVRAAATLTLGKTGGAEAAEALKKLAKDSSMLVRSTARKVLGHAA